MENLWLVIIVGAIYFAFFLFKKRVNTSWEEAADHFGLEHTSGGVLNQPKIVGEVHGVPVKIRVHSVKSWWSTRRSNYTHYTELNAELASPWNCQAQITKRGFTDKVAELFGGEDIKIGDEEFDREFRLRGHVSDEIGGVLMKEQVQSGLRRLASTFYKLSVQYGAIQVRNEGRVANPNKLIRQITAVVDVARELNEGIGASNAPVPPPLPKEQVEDDPFPDFFGAPDDPGREKQERPTIRELYSEPFDVSPDEGSRDAAEKVPESNTEPIW